MATAVWVELVCASCSQTTGGRYSYNGQIPLKKLKTPAKKAGWSFKYDEAFCSTECLKRYESEQG